MNMSPSPEHPLSLAGLVVRHDSTAVRELLREHGALLRQLGGLQRRMGEVQRAERERARELEAQNLRLRAELVVLRTGVLWGLGTGAVVRRARPPARDSHAFDPALRAAQAVICQTGCVGHAHPWLEADGQCRRSGQACERPVDEAYEAHALGASDPAPR